MKDFYGYDHKVEHKEKAKIVNIFMIKDGGYTQGWTREDFIRNNYIPADNYYGAEVEFKNKYHLNGQIIEEMISRCVPLGNSKLFTKEETNNHTPLKATNKLKVAVRKAGEVALKYLEKCNKDFAVINYKYRTSFAERYRSEWGLNFEDKYTKETSELFCFLMDIVIANFYEWNYTEEDIINVSISSLLQTITDTLERISIGANKNGQI